MKLTVFSKAQRRVRKMNEIDIMSLMNAIDSYVNGDRKYEDKQMLLNWIHKWLINESVGLYESSSSKEAESSEGKRPNLRQSEKIVSGTPTEDANSESEKENGDGKE